jgi:putative peptidoglycan binding protein
VAQPPTLRRGSRGDAVKGLQNALNARSFHVRPGDGIFGPATENTVKHFQRSAGLADDGIVGPNTWGSLCVHVVERGDTLSDIAGQRLGDANRFQEIFHLSGIPTRFSPTRCWLCRKTPVFTNALSVSARQPALSHYVPGHNHRLACDGRLGGVGLRARGA